MWVAVSFDQIWHLISVRAHGPPQRGRPAMLARGSGRATPQASVDGKTPSKAAWEMHVGLFHKSISYHEEFCTQGTLSDQAMTLQTGSNEVVPSFNLVRSFF